MESDRKARLKQWLESGEARLCPLTFPQRELWETSPVVPGDTANHICGFIEIKGGITFKECATALQRVIDRQEALRISFLPGKDRSLQLVRASGAPVLGYRELSTGEARPEAMEDLMQETYRMPFDMVQGPLHRVEMMRRGPNDHVLVFSIHHAIADGWSLGVFMDDLRTAYIMGLSGFRKEVATGVMGLPAALPPVTQTYTAWAAAERAAWQPEELKSKAAFWKTQLEGSRRLWSHHATVPHSGPLLRWVSVVPAPLTRAVKDLALQARMTLFSTLLNAFQLTLSKWTGVDDIVVGTPVANRSTEAVRQTMGYFAGVVPLRRRVDPAQSFEAGLQTGQTEVMDAFANAMPFAELASSVGGGKTGHAVFDVRFALQNHPVPDVALPRISTRLRVRSTGTARFDLGCEITEIGPELEVVWLFHSPLLGLPEITELNTLFLALLTKVCRSPGSRVAASSV